MQESEGVLCMRVSFRIALAGQVIGVSALYEQTRTFCKNYLTDAPASFEVAVTPSMLFVWMSSHHCSKSSA